MDKHSFLQTHEDCKSHASLGLQAEEGVLSCMTLTLLPTWEGAGKVSRLPSVKLSCIFFSSKKVPHKNSDDHILEEVNFIYYVSVYSHL